MSHNNIAPGTRLGKWQVRSQIARGYQASIYEVTEAEGKAKHALKYIDATSFKKRARFIQEIQTHAELSTSGARNIMGVVDHNLEELQNDGMRGWIVMPRARTDLDRQLPLIRGRVELATELITGIVQGIRSAHEVNVVHRDIKPANILFMDYNLREPLVSDFGICLLRDTPEGQRLTDIRETAGAKFFMAPEQERGGKAEVTPAADIYAFGKLYHYMLTGRTLYREELTEAFTKEELESDERFAFVLGEILSKTIVENPEKRIQNCDELLSLLDLLRKQRLKQAERPNQPILVAQPTTVTIAPTVTNGLKATFDQVLRDIDDGKLKPLQIQADTLKTDFDNAWADIHEIAKTARGQSSELAMRLAQSQGKLFAYSAAIARYDCADLFLPVKRTIEHILAVSNSLSGYSSVIAIPYATAGFIYMSMATVALASESWKVLDKCINAKFEWGRSSGRSVYDYGFDLGYFFHSDAFGRSADKIHDAYRAQLLSEPFIQVLGLRDMDCLNYYIQAQFLMSLRVAQERLRGNQDVRIWPDFGRFHAERVERLLDKAHNEHEYGLGIFQIFQESRDQFFAHLNERIEFIIKELWGGGSGYFYDSLESWTPRH